MGRFDQHAGSRRVDGLVAECEEVARPSADRRSHRSFGFISPRMRMSWLYSSRALTASRMRWAAPIGSSTHECTFLRGPATGRCRDSRAPRRCRLPFFAPPPRSGLRGAVGRERAVDRARMPPTTEERRTREQSSPSRIFFSSPRTFCSAAASWSMSGTASSSCSCTPSKPRFLYSRSLAAKETSLRTSGPNGSRPVLMFQGPKVKR